MDEAYLKKHPDLMKICKDAAAAEYSKIREEQRSKTATKSSVKKSDSSHKTEDKPKEKV